MTQAHPTCPVAATHCSQEATYRNSICSCSPSLPWASGFLYLTPAHFARSLGSLSSPHSCPAQTLPMSIILLTVLLMGHFQLLVHAGHALEPCKYKHPLWPWSLCLGHTVPLCLPVLSFLELSIAFLPQIISSCTGVPLWSPLAADPLSFCPAVLGVVDQLMVQLHKASSPHVGIYCFGYQERHHTLSIFHLTDSIMAAWASAMRLPFLTHPLPESLVGRPSFHCPPCLLETQLPLNLHVGSTDTSNTC